jgi:hypothetical protein
MKRDGIVIVILDTAGVEGLAPVDEKRRARLLVLRQQVTDFVAPAAVLAEGVLIGNPRHDVHVRRLLADVHIAEINDRLGYAAGALRTSAIRAAMDPAPPGVDAIVAAVADERAAREVVAIITSDADDMELLASLGHNLDRLSVIGV